jgi:hypothetical protein
MKTIIEDVKSNLLPFFTAFATPSGMQIRYVKVNPIKPK